MRLRIIIIMHLLYILHLLIFLCQSYLYFCLIQLKLADRKKPNTEAKEAKIQKALKLVELRY